MSDPDWLVRQRDEIDACQPVRPVDVTCPLCGKLTQPGLLANPLVDIGKSGTPATEALCNALRLTLRYPRSVVVPAWTRCCLRPAMFDGLRHLNVIPFPPGLHVKDHRG